MRKLYEFFKVLPFQKRIFAAATISGNTVLMHLGIFFKEKNQRDSTDFECCQNCVIFEEVVDNFGRSDNNQIRNIQQLCGPNFTKFCPTVIVHVLTE